MNCDENEYLSVLSQTKCFWSYWSFFPLGNYIIIALDNSLLFRLQAIIETNADVSSVMNLIFDRKSRLESVRQKLVMIHMSRMIKKVQISMDTGVMISSM